MADDTAPRNWFDDGGKSYAAFRPDYPDDLAPALAALAPRRGTAVDVGCGSGQLTAQLAPHFDRVIGLDPSSSQIANAVPVANVEYLVAPAEDIPLADGSADIITVAQAAHWFDLPAFYGEARRIAAPGAVLALITYGVLNLEGEHDERFQKFYWQEIGPFWPAERKHVDEGYRNIHFPYDDIEAPRLDIVREWTLPEFLGYVATWSATKAVREAGREDILVNYAEDASKTWSGDQRVRVTWPVSIRMTRF